MNLPSPRLQRVQKAVFSWYEEQGRELPWRNTRDPYAILLAEMMLQQTQVERVVPKYAAFLANFPTIEALAAASPGQVIRSWAGLGYNRRAIRLHHIAQEVVANYNGIVPTDPDCLQKFSGIGRYTASAVACFTTEAPMAVLDTNIRRVLGRVFEDVWKADNKASYIPSERMGWLLAEAALPRASTYEWNQGLMDLGATICASTRPSCGSCPLSYHCSYHQEKLTTNDLGPLFEDSHTTPDPNKTQENEAQPARYRVAQQKRPNQAKIAMFKGSRRWYRGRILQYLRTLSVNEKVPLNRLGRELRDDFASDHTLWLAELIVALSNDGLVEYTGSISGCDCKTIGDLEVSLPD